MIVAVSATELLLIGLIKMAINTVKNLVGTAINGERVVKHGALPGDRVVTDRARGTEPRSEVIRIGRLLIVGQVAGHTICG